MLRAWHHRNQLPAEALQGPRNPDAIVKATYLAAIGEQIKTQGCAHPEKGSAG